MGSSGKRPKRRSGRPAENAAGKEIEVKLRLGDRTSMRRRLAKLRAEPLGVRVHEMNTLYDTADGALAANGQLVRIRIEHPASGGGVSRRETQAGTSHVRALLTHKGPPEGNLAGTADSHRYKIREEQESQIENPEELAKVFKAMGLLPWFRYEKYRSTYRLPGIPGVKVELDETPIGDFLELEGQPAAIDRAAKRLGFRPSDYITKSYGALFMEQEAGVASCQSEPNPSDCLPDMIFKTQN